jgi:tetratricopeptide (TPR) repeat protein
VGARLLAASKIAEAWTYFRLIGEPQPVAQALERFDPSIDDAEQLGELLQIALNEGVHPTRGFELVLERHGVCNAITTVAQTLYQPGSARLHAIRRLVQTLHGEVTDRLRADLKQRSGVEPPPAAMLAELAQARSDLFDDDNYHVDLSHLSSVVQFALELPPGDETRLAEELCTYGQQLNPRFQPPSDPPFGEGYAAYRRYFETLNRKNVAENLAWFRAQAVPYAEDAATGPAEVLVHLLAQLERYEEALAAYREFLSQADPRRLACPSPIVLSQKLGRFDGLAELCQLRGDLVGFAAACLEEGKTLAAATKGGGSQSE